jgi:putative ABC transport system substrate-binding protein
MGVGINDKAHANSIMTGGRSKMRTSKLICILIAGVLLFASPALAKSIGVVMTGDIKYYNDIHKAFIDAMTDAITQEGIEVNVQTPMPATMSWVNSVRKLVALRSNFIVSYGMPATLIAMKETSDIPIVFAGVYSPESVNISGKNATGISSTVSLETVIKSLMKIRKISTLGVIFSKSEKDTILQAKEIKKLEKKLGFKTVLIAVQNGVDKTNIRRVDAFLITTSSGCFRAIGDVIDIARKGKILTAAVIGGCAEKGVILTFAPSPAEQGKELAKSLKKVMGGAKPSDIPFKQPGQMEIVVNLREAKALGFDIPPGVSGTATRIIE